MIDSMFLLGITALVLGSNATIIGFLLKIYFKVAINSRDIKYIKQSMHFCNDNRNDRNGSENKEI